MPEYMKEHGLDHDDGEPIPVNPRPGIFQVRPMRYGAYNPTVTEPEDPVPVCECTRCRQDVYRDEYTIDGGAEEMSSVCEDCFEMWVAGMLGTQGGRHQLARMMGFEVVCHEG